MSTEEITVYNEAELNLEETCVFEDNKSLRNENNKRKIMIDEKRGQKLIFIALLVLIVLLPISRIASVLAGVFYNMIVQSVFLMVFLGVSLIIIVIESVHKRIDWNGKKLPCACLFISWLFTFVVSLDVAVPSLAFFGFSLRGEGLLPIGAYYITFILTTMLVEKKYQSRLIYVFFLMSMVYAIIGVFPFFNIYGFGDYFPGMASFPFINPNFYASYMVLFAGAAMGCYWIYRKDSSFLNPFSWWNRGCWLVIVAISYIGCVVSHSSSAYVGLIMIFMLFIFLNLISKRKSIFHIGVLFFVLLIVMTILDILSEGSIRNELLANFYAIEKEGSLFGDSVGTGRMGIWKNVVGLLPIYWLYGCGIEHLGFAYVVVYGYTESGQMVDKAHNEYLNMWISQGIIPLVLYLVFLFALFIPGILQYIKKNKYETDDIRMMAVFPFFGYIAQAFFNISIIQVAPFFWFFCGFLFHKQKEIIHEETLEGTEKEEKEIKDCENANCDSFTVE